ncbi:stalk domain-containing protein [Cohnella abietis]|uniref:Copper amine oxidase-like N-terminal domain-containing protein n=1 Tax=Cohnella abietis TaxID=2507935 RepID=A0A3T1D297_9BACL|nr:stalk domain-containing protein [Cohnella abietis]BBI32115.1 hypothetical protein KCTCHS21_15140 [Cohnella abietis]
MKKFFITISIFLLFLFTVNNVTFASNPKGDTLLDRAMNAYNPELKNTHLRVVQDKKVKEFKYKEQFIPVRDLFGPYVDSIKWDNKTKIAVVSNNSSELVLNFSGKNIVAKENQVVLPTEWIRVNKGRIEINAFVVAYLFDKYSDSYGDNERDQWEEELAFLDIKESEGIPGVRDGYLHVYILKEPLV